MLINEQKQSKRTKELKSIRFYVYFSSSLKSKRTKELKVWTKELKVWTNQ